MECVAQTSAASHAKVQTEVSSSVGSMKVHSKKDSEMSSDGARALASTGVERVGRYEASMGSGAVDSLGCPETETN